MGSYQYFPGTPNWNAASVGGQHLTIGLDYYTVTTAINILPAASVTTYTDVANVTTTQANVAAYANSVEFVPGTIPNDFSQDALDRLVEIVTQRGQPIIMGNPTGTGPYVFKFAIEHSASWLWNSPLYPTGVPVGADLPIPAFPGVAAPNLANAIQTGGKDFGFDLDTTLTVMVASTFA